MSWEQLAPARILDKMVKISFVTAMSTSSRKFHLASKGFSVNGLWVWVAVLLLGAVRVEAQTNLVISSLNFKAAVVWSNALPGHSYAVQRADMLETGAWSTVPGFSNVAPTGSMMTALIPVSGPTGFFRVLDNGACCTNTGGTNPFSAVTLGPICGDVAGSPIVISGCGGGWFRVRINECSGAPSIVIQATVTLTAPAADDYDLYLYDTSFVEIRSSTQRPVVVCVERPDTSGDRSFEFVIEVRPFNAFSCDNWTLDIRRTSSGGCAIVP